MKKIVLIVLIILFLITLFIIPAQAEARIEITASDFEKGGICVIIWTGGQKYYYKSVADALKHMNEVELRRAQVGSKTCYTREEGFIGLYLLKKVPLRTIEKVHITTFWEFNEEGSE